MDASWAGVIVAVVVAIGSAVGFWFNRRDIRQMRKARDEVRWALSETAGKGTLLLTNTGRHTAYDVQASGGVKTIFEPGDIAGRGAKRITCITAYGADPPVLTVTWATRKGSDERREWSHPYTPTAEAP